MKVFLSLCVLVATAVAHPTSCPPPPCPPPPCPPPPCPPPPCPPPPCPNPPPPPCPNPPPPPCPNPPPPPCPPPPCPNPCPDDCPPPPCPNPCPDDCPPPPPCGEVCSDYSITSSSSTTVKVITEATYVTEKTLYPSYVPNEWNIVEFDSTYATQAFQGVWILSMCTPIVSIDGLVPLHLGIFYNGFPCVNPRICFEDTTPNCVTDYNTNFVFSDMCFNLITQQMEKTKGLLKAAYPESTLAIFDVCTESYYPSVITEVDVIIDDKLVKIPCDDTYKRDYIIACIGADECWNEYMVFVICNKYDSLFGGKDKYFILVLTREVNPCPCVYERAFNDIKASGLSPYYLITVDQSIDLPSVPGIDLEGLVESSSMVVETKSIDTTTVMSGGTSSSTSSGVSTDYFVLRPDYKPVYEVEVYEYCGKIKILKGLPLDALQDIMNGKWFVQSGTPCLLEEVDKPKYGLLHNTFPCRSLQIEFDTSVPWCYKSPLMMSERAYDAMTGEVTTTRSLIVSAFDANSPYSAFIVYTEGCYGKPIPKCVTITPDGCVIESPGSLYVDYYMIYIIGYKIDEYVILYIPPTYTNLFCEEDEEGLIYVLTRSRIVCGSIIDEINQQILLCGCNPNHLISIDQYLEIEETCVFDASYYEYTYSSSSSCSSFTVEQSSSTCVTSSCGC